MFAQEDAKKKILVRVQKMDGEELSGYLLIPQHSGLVSQINNDTKFVEFQDLAGNGRYIAKQAIAELGTDDLSKAELPTAQTSSNADPYQVLGVPKSASIADVRHAYLAITKQYHPDQFSNVELPEEVLQYMSAKFSQANTAYNLIKGMTSNRNAA